MSLATKLNAYQTQNFYLYVLRSNLLPVSYVVNVTTQSKVFVLKSGFYQLIQIKYVTLLNQSYITNCLAEPLNLLNNCMFGLFGKNSWFSSWWSSACIQYTVVLVSHVTAPLILGEGAHENQHVLFCIDNDFTFFI